MVYNTYRSPIIAVNRDFGFDRLVGELLDEKEKRKEAEAALDLTVDIPGLPLPIPTSCSQRLD